MEVGRLIVAAGFFGIAFGALAMFGNESPVMSVKNAELQPMGRGFALIANIENTGKPDRLLGIGSESAMETNMRGGITDSLPIPAESTPSLAMDGAHAMLSGVQGGVEEGRLVPVTFWFENAGRVQTRARIVGAMAMDHGETMDLPDDGSAPTLDLIVSQDKEDWLLSLATTNFEFSADAVDGAHQPGVGHGHLYLNGLKIQRVYDAEARIGALPPGTYEIYIALNTNDHKGYAVEGVPIGAAATIKVE